MAHGTSPKKDKIILLLKQGETSKTIMAIKSAVRLAMSVL